MANIKLSYTKIDGLLYPNIVLDDAELCDDLGKYGNLRLCYLHENKPGIYRELLFTGKLAQHCADIDKSAFEMAERIRAEYLDRNPPPEDCMARIQAFTQAQMIADETVMHDLIYT